MPIKIASMNFGDCDTILRNTPNGMKNIAEVLGPNGEVYWSAIKELTGVLPLSIRSNGTMLLDYLISGNLSQTGTPTPQNPVQPQETGERTGNLWDSGDVTIALHERYKAIPISLEQGAYTLSFEYKSENTGTVTVIFYNESTTIQSFNVTITNNKGNISITSGQPITIIRLYSASGYITSYNYAAEYTNIMLNTGSTTLPYEPYGYKIPISSANTTTPVYLGEVESTRKIGKLVLTGNEIFYRDKEREGSWQFYTEKLVSTKGYTGICSHFENISINDVNNSDNIGFSFFNGAQFGCRCPKSIANTVTDFKSYLAQQYAAGTPVTVWYVLATPTTGTVNEPLRKIGDYADTVSMEQARVQIPTNRGNTVIDVETTLKPSQMYIKYK